MVVVDEVSREQAAPELYLLGWGEQLYGVQLIGGESWGHHSVLSSAGEGEGGVGRRRRWRVLSFWGPLRPTEDVIRLEWNDRRRSPQEHSWRDSPSSCVRR